MADRDRAGVGNHPRWHVVVTGPQAGDQRREALDFMAVSLGHRPGTFTVVHRCPVCRSADHGAPAVDYSRLARRRRGPDAVDPADPLPAVSFSRARGWLATAWVDPESAGEGWRVGVDLEEADSAAFQTAEGLGDVAFSPDEASAVSRLPAADRPAARARLWTLKEAVVKARGTGFNVDPSNVDVTARGTLETRIPGHPEAVVVPDEEWPGGPLTEGLIGIVSLLHRDAPDGGVSG